MKPEWWSQPFPPEGGPAGEGIAQQLGRPALDPLTVLVREAAQNSWDARQDDLQPVRFTMDLRRLGSRADTWQSTLLPGPRMDGDKGVSPLEESLTADSYVLIISDRNTRGLGGPLRADERGPDGVPANFVQFLRNVGEPSDHEFGGGTFGYGKGILYGLSASRTILVDSHTIDGLGSPRRLMGSALGHSFHGDDVRYTGRHWWGVEEGSVTNPVGEPRASELAESLGMPGFHPHEFGTDIAIVGFDLGFAAGDDGEARARTHREAGVYLASSILWNLWPKMGSLIRSEKMIFSVLVDGEPIVIPQPDDHPLLRGFSLALDAIYQGDAIGFTRTVEPRHAGDLALLSWPTNPVGLGADSEVTLAASPLESPMHHIARMRVPELVVDYYEGPLRSDAQLGYLGVFRATREADLFFALSEPPTHDDWVTQGLAGAARGVVRGCRSFIGKSVSDRFLSAEQAAGTDAAGLGHLSVSLASLIPATSGLGPATQGNERPGGDGGSGQTGTGRRRPRVVTAPHVEIIDGVPCVVADVLMPTSDKPVEVEALAFVGVDGGARESDPPLGGPTPSVVRWGSADHALSLSNSRVTVPPAVADTLWQVQLQYVEDAVVGLEIRVVSDE